MNCRLCDHVLSEVMDFGRVALAGGYLRPDQFAAEKKYPLTLMFCEGCFAVQLGQTIDPATLFNDYRYRSSSTQTARKHFQRYAKEVVSRFHPKSVLEIGCNDGVMLYPLAALVDTVIGVDPSNVVPRNRSVINDFFTRDVAKDVGPVDMVIANNVFAHMDDLNEVTEAVKIAMKDDGIFIFESHYLGDMVQDGQYDVIYHEHIYHHSLVALQRHFARHGMTIVDVQPVALHAGSMRYYVRKGDAMTSGAVADLRAMECVQGLNRRYTYELFREQAESHRRTLNFALDQLEGRIAGYGASGRANTLIQYCGIEVDYIVDDSPARAGLCTPGSHIPIVSELGNPDYVLLFAWSYADEILTKHPRMAVLVPFPTISLWPVQDMAAA